MDPSSPLSPRLTGSIHVLSEEPRKHPLGDIGIQHSFFSPLKAKRIRGKRQQILLRHEQRKSRSRASVMEEVPPPPVSEIKGPGKGKRRGGASVTFAFSWGASGEDGAFLLLEHQRNHCQDQVFWGLQDPVQRAWQCLLWHRKNRGSGVWGRSQGTAHGTEGEDSVPGLTGRLQFSSALTVGLQVLFKKRELRVWPRQELSDPYHPTHLLVMLLFPP